MILTVTLNPSIDVSAATQTVTAEHKLRCTGVRRDPGGGAIDAARALKRFGVDCRALYPAGGILGKLLHRLLEEERIASIPLDIAAETRESFTVLERASGSRLDERVELQARGHPEADAALERELDQALEATFPASDPLAVDTADEHDARRKRVPGKKRP